MKPRIGSRWALPWFERRASDGRYEGLHAPMDDDAFVLQRCLLPAGPRRLRGWVHLALWASVLVAMTQVAS